MSKKKKLFLRRAFLGLLSAFIFAQGAIVVAQESVQGAVDENGGKPVEESLLRLSASG